MAALHAEWTKLRTLAGNAWLLLAVVALTVSVSAGVLTVTTCSTGDCGADAARVSLSGIYLGQVAVAILAVLAVGGEYGTGMIRTTLTAIPGRSTILAAKAAVLIAAVLVAGTVAVFGSLLAGWIILPGNGFTEDHGYQMLSLADGPLLRAGIGSVCYLILIALLSLGVATAVRDSAAAIGVVLGLLYLFPIITQMIRDPEWQRHLQQIAPMTAGLAVQATVGLADLPIAPWKGLGVLAAWAVGALLIGGWLLRSRDA
ncbi:MAG TPA: ABC transporter permease subunit [Kineosporiaceae bacterium]|nr:ABC transporter permease subunit [Kineosporiaceae bacterium]